MTILNWVAGFQVRTGWRFLSPAESADLSEAMGAPEAGRLRAIARHRESGRLVCLDATERDPLRARVLVLYGEGAKRPRVEEEHASLSDWLHVLGLISDRKAPGAHDGG
ncbi:MAG: hypothetical protein ACLFWF_01360 [Alphaproteobacteria bacterium]